MSTSLLIVFAENKAMVELMCAVNIVLLCPESRIWTAVGQPYIC